MNKRIALHGYVYDTLRGCDKVNLASEWIFRFILDSGYSRGDFAEPPHVDDNCRRISIYIPEDLFVDLSYYNLRAILYWFVDNEIYNSAEWMEYLRENHVELNYLKPAKSVKVKVKEPDKPKEESKPEELPRDPIDELYDFTFALHKKHPKMNFKPVYLAIRTMRRRKNGVQ